MKNEVFFFKQQNMQTHTPSLDRAMASLYILDPLENSNVHLGGNESETGK